MSPLKNAEIKPDGFVICSGKGSTCFVPAEAEWFRTPRNRGQFFDEGLADLIQRLNTLLNEERQRRGEQDTTLSILITEEGLVLALVRPGTDAEAGRGISAEEDPRAFAEALGLR